MYNAINKILLFSYFSKPFGLFLQTARILVYWHRETTCCTLHQQNFSLSTHKIHFPIFFFSEHIWKTSKKTKNISAYPGIKFIFQFFFSEHILKTSKKTKNKTKANVYLYICWLLLPGLFLRISKSLNGPWSSICWFKKTDDPRFKIKNVVTYSMKYFLPPVEYN